MNITIKLPDDQAEALKAQAAAQGLSVKDWLQRIAADHARSSAAASDARVRNFRAWLEDRNPNTPVLSDEAMSRESIYPDRL